MKILITIFIMLCSITLYSQDTIVKRALRSPHLLDWGLITNDTINYLLGLEDKNIYKSTNIKNNLSVTGVVGINSANKFSGLSVVSTTATNGNNMFNFVSKANLNRSTYEQAIDTSSFSFKFNASNNYPFLKITDEKGRQVFEIDTGIYHSINFGNNYIYPFALSGYGLVLSYTGIYAGNHNNGFLVLGNRLTFIGGYSHDIYVDANPTAAASGKNLNIWAGRTKSGNTDQNGGDLNLGAGLSTGTGFQSIKLSRHSRAISTSTTDNAISEAMIIPSSKLIADSTSTDLFSVECDTGSSAGMTINYTIKTQAGAINESHIEVGTLEVIIANDGVVTVSVTKSHSSQLITDTGTYTVTFEGSSANPSVISVLADSTLDVNSKISYNIVNKDEQIITQL